MSSHLRALAFAAALLIPALAAHAQFTINWYTIDAGGGASSSSRFTLRATIGQHDAGLPMTAGATIVSGGYWPAPKLPPPTCGTSDFNGDGDYGTDADIEAFFACLAGNCCQTCYAGGSDFNADGDYGTDADIESFFRVLAGGQC